MEEKYEVPDDDISQKRFKKHSTSMPATLHLNLDLLNHNNLDWSKIKTTRRDINTPGHFFFQDKSGLKKQKRAQSTQGLKTPRFPTTFLSQQPRLRSSSEIISSRRNEESPIQKIAFQGNWIATVNRLKNKLLEGTQTVLTKEELSHFFNYCNNYSLRKNNHLRNYSLNVSLSPFIYHQILSFLHNQQETQQEAFKQHYSKLHQKLLSRYQQLSPVKKTIEPDYAALTEKKSRQTALRLIWQLSLAQLEAEDFSNAVKGLCHRYNISDLINDFRLLIPLMRSQQHLILQIVVASLIHLNNTYNSSNYKSVESLLKIFKKKSKKLIKQDAYFVPDLIKFLHAHKRLKNSRLTRNISCLQQWYARCIKDSEVISFNGLIKHGIEENGKSEQNVIASEIAAEMTNASCYYYSRLSLRELYLPEKEQKGCKQFTYYIVTLTQTFKNTLSQLSDKEFANAIHLLVSVTKNLESINYQNSFLDLNSLMILSTIFANGAIAQRIENARLSKEDKSYIAEMMKKLSPFSNFSYFRDMARKLDKYLPPLVLVLKDLEFAKEGNPDPCLHLAACGKIINNIHNIQQQLFLKQPFFLNTSILNNIKAKDWQSTKALEKTIYFDDEHISDVVTEIESTIKQGYRPLLEVAASKEKIEANNICPYLLRKCCAKMYPIGSKEAQKLTKLERRIHKIGLTIKARGSEKQQESSQVEIDKNLSVRTNSNRSSNRRHSLFYPKTPSSFNVESSALALTSSRSNRYD